MAKLINMTSFSGALGDVVGCDGPFGFYLRSRPGKSEKAPTIRQLESRAKLALVMNFLVPLREMIYRGFATSYGPKAKTAAMNRATAHVIRYALEGNYPDLFIDPAKVELSRGFVQKLSNVESVMQDDQLYVHWKVETGRFYAFADDWVYILAYNVTEKVVVVGEAKRGSGLVLVDLEAETKGSELLVYACVAHRDGKKFSNSQFLGTFYR